MANKLQTLLQGANTPRHPYREIASIFPALDLESNSRRLRVAERGATRGAAEQPLSTASDFDEVEREIIATIQAVAKEHHEAYRDMLRVNESRIVNQPFQASFQSLKDKTAKALSDFSRVAGIGSDLLFRNRRDVVDTEKELANFRAEHGIDRPPRTPISRWLGVSILTLMIVLEGAINGTFLAKGNELGLVGGISVALIIATFNVAWGWVSGRLVLPLTVRRGLLYRLAGFLLTPAAVGGTAAFNLGVTHYRLAVATAQPELAATRALETLLANPLGITDVESWMLFLAGCFFAFVAFFEGWRWDDPYPGYGRLTRHSEQIRDDYIEAKQEQMEELEEIRDHALAEIEKCARQLEKSKAEYRQALDSIKQLPVLLKQSLQHLESCANTLLERYRDANRQARSTPPPLHFSRAWIMPPLEIAAASIPGLTNEQLEAEITEAFRTLNEDTRALHRRHDECVAEYRRIEALSGATVAP